MGGRPRVPVAPCKYCDRSFKRREHLERHLRTHTRERPFECGCGRMFSRQDLLTRHYRLAQCPGAPTISEASRQDEGHLLVNFSTASPSSPLSSAGLSSSSQQLDGSHGADATMLASESTTARAFNSRLNPRNYAALQPRDRPPTTQTPIVQTTNSSFGNITAANQLSPVRDQQMAMQIVIENDVVGLQAIQAETFPADFMPNEADMIDDYDYLRGVFSPSINHDLFMSDLPGFYEPLPNMEGSATQNSPPARTVITPNPQLKQTPLAAMPSTVQLNQGTSDLIGQSPAQIRGSLDAIDDIAASNPWTISSSAYTRLQTEVNKYTDVLPEPFTLPSRQKLSRFIASWMRGYHPHLPFLHIPTASIDSMKPMLILTLAATGSFYGFEHTEGYPMYFLAKAMIIKELERRRQRATVRLLRGLPQYAELPSHHSVSPSRNPSLYSPSQPVAFDLELLQALLVLIMTMSWLDGPFAEEALAMSSQLSALTREALSQAPLQDNDVTSWTQWGKEEERRRTIFASYFTLNIQTICFNVPPQLTNSEIKLPLPCSEADFRAPTASAWHSIKRINTAEQRDYQQCLKQLLSGKPLNLAPTEISEFGTYLLVQSLLMQIYFERQAVTPLLGTSQSLDASTIALYDKALSAWQSCWDSAIESTLDPSTSPNGPLAFNSAAVLRLAHTHLGAGLQHHCELLTRDPEVLAQAFEPHRNPIPLRATHLTRTVFHAVCALRIPVRVGIAYVARGRTGHWSVQHAISNFTCALLLTHWLENMHTLVATEGLEALLSEERRLLSTIERLIEETHLESELGPKDMSPDRIRRLSIAALRLWAETCKGIQVYEIVHVVGETLSIAADTIERRL